MHFLFFPRSITTQSDLATSSSNNIESLPSWAMEHTLLFGLPELRSQQSAQDYRQELAPR
ncbi:hypothetical protein G647_00501 [Cladophialophora carrionii CBS 160.54]|uniref:Uncharacterized protein n=1 Tax=Cladophialophora carrionii CBS 160.54 TaxID=1279043 RepID=V9DQ18_9EURO|nr:uncharacterized protein G647_00501 [Cladophialophora carrionii CBS 160.54]ETI28052.1 hypothetical protein G647_00501 [Cladophialophora carrionii CBS 160.54]